MTIQERSILWNPSLSEKCHQIRAGFETDDGGMIQEMWPLGNMDGYQPHSDRPCSCKKEAFLSQNGECPDNIILVYRLAQAERGLPHAWDYEFGSELIGGKATPYLEMYLGQDDRDPCGHREIGLFHYSVLASMRHCQVRQNPDHPEGLWPLTEDYDLIYRFKYKVLERTASTCDGKPMRRKNLIKSIVMYDHLSPDGDIKKRRPNAISIWIDRFEGRMKPVGLPGKVADWCEKDNDVIWWNQCRAHGDWGNQTCMLTLWIGDSTMVRAIPGSEYTDVEINLSDLFRRYAMAFPAPFGQSNQDAVFRNVAAVGAVTGSKLRFRIADVDLLRRDNPTTPGRSVQNDR